jgi:hypothetical protein
LLVSQQLSKIMKSASLDCKKYIHDLYNATMLRLKQTDIDQEVKERAISCVYVINFNKITLTLFFSSSIKCANNQPFR